QTARIMDGHGRLMARKPPLPGSTSAPVSSTTVAAMPGSGSVHEPGLVGVAPGNGLIMWPPVSVCHQVSTMGQRSWPTFLWYHIPASGWMVSPTVPMMRRLSRLELRGCVEGVAADALISGRMAVGAV